MLSSILSKVSTCEWFEFQKEEKVTEGLYKEIITELKSAERFGYSNQWSS